MDNWRWQGVPFYLRTGKRLPAKISEVAIQFRPVPHQTFPAAALIDWRLNRLLLAIQPQKGIFLRSEAYETLLLDVMWGNTILFIRADQTHAVWQVLSPILQAWGKIKPFAFPNYQAGTWGPEEAEILIARDGRSWVMPAYLQCQKNLAACHLMNGTQS